MGEKIWELILKNILLNLLKNSIDQYIKSKGGVSLRVPMNIEHGAPTPTFSLGGDPKLKQTKQKKKMDFNDDTVMKALQKNDDE